MDKEVEKRVWAIIEKEYLTDWEFIVNKIAPEFEEHELDIDQVADMLHAEIRRRNIELWTPKLDQVTRHPR